MRLVPVLNAGRDGRIAVSLFCCCCYYFFLLLFIFLGGLKGRLFHLVAWNIVDFLRSFVIHYFSFCSKWSRLEAVGKEWCTFWLELYFASFGPESKCFGGWRGRGRTMTFPLQSAATPREKSRDPRTFAMREFSEERILRQSVWGYLGKSGFGDSQYEGFFGRVDFGTVTMRVERADFGTKHPWVWILGQSVWGYLRKIQEV